MKSDQRSDPFFLADHRALDFLNSVAAPWGEPIEWLGDGGDLIDWLRRASLVEEAVLIRVTKDLPREDLDRAALKARELREWFREFLRQHAGTVLSKAALRALAPLNRLLGTDEAYRQIKLATAVPAGEGAGLHWSTQRRWRSAATLLLPIAEAIGDLVCSPRFTDVKKCESCTLWFLDSSQAHSRRWCSMAVCGNRAKAAAMRARRKASAG